MDKLNKECEKEEALFDGSIEKDRFIKKTIANLSSRLQLLPSTADKSNLKQPYSNYNIFFRLERTYILQSTEGVVDKEVLESLDPNHEDPIEFPRPAKYAHLVLPPYWYSNLHSDVVEKKRRHRKCIGRIDMATLSKMISETWKVVDRDIVDYCNELAHVGVMFYRCPGTYWCRRSGTYKRSIKGDDATATATAAVGRDSGNEDSSNDEDQKNSDIDTPSHQTNVNQKEIHQEEGMQLNESSSSPDPNARTTGMTNEEQENQHMRKTTNNNEGVHCSSLLHPDQALEGIPRETRDFFHSRADMEEMAACEASDNGFAPPRRHSSNKGYGDSGFAGFAQHYFPYGPWPQLNALTSLPNQYDDDSFYLRGYVYPQALHVLSHHQRVQLMLSDARREEACNRFMMLARHTPMASYQGDMHNPQAVLRSMSTSNTTGPNLGIRTDHPPDDDSATDSTKTIPNLDIRDSRSPSSSSNVTNPPKTVPNLGIRDYSNGSPAKDGIAMPYIVSNVVPSSDVQDQPKTPESDKPISLFIPSDLKVLDPVHNFPRCHCIKLFEKAEGDCTLGRVGQVGLRCFYCNEACFPSKRETIYENVLSFQQNHLENCPFFPEKMKAKYKTLVQQEYWSSRETKRPSIAFLRAYYAEAASELGLMDSPEGGLKFGAPQNRSDIPSKRLLSLLESAGFTT